VGTLFYIKERKKMQKPNVMLIGEMASGKSHAARFLCDKYGYTLLSLAQPVKDIEEVFHQYENKIINDLVADEDIWRILGSEQIIDNGMYWEFIKILEEELPKIPREDPKPRKRLQYIGTDLGRKQISENLWIDIAMKRVKEEIGPFVIDDLRFLNEYEIFKTIGFIPIKLIMSPQIQQKRLEVLYGFDEDEISLQLTHESETELNRIEINEKYNVDADQNLITMYEEIEQKLNLK